MIELKENNLKAGVTIKCHSEDEMLRVMDYLENEFGIHTDFDYSEPNKIKVVNHY